MTQPAFNQSREPQDLEHYGVPGMKWGKSGGGKSGGGIARTERGQARQERNSSILAARVNQTRKAAEIKSLSQERAKASSAKGKAKLDTMIRDKEFALKNSNDASLASQRTSGEKWMKAAKTTALIGTSLVVGNTVANILSEEFNARNGLKLEGKTMDEINGQLLDRGDISMTEYANRHSDNINNK